MSMVKGNKWQYEEVRKEITQEYSQGVRDRGYLAIAKKQQLPVVTVPHVIARAELAGWQSCVAGPQEEKAEQVKRQKCARLLIKTTATNRQLRAVVRDKIEVRAYLARADPPFTTVGELSGVT